MWYVYALHNLDKSKIYIGMSENPDERLIAHNKGKVKSTKPYKPWVKFFSEEAGSDAAEAREKEKYYKSSTGRRYSKSHLSINQVSVYLPSFLRQNLSQKQLNLFSKLSN
jgi:putative endonuclease